MKIKNQIKFIQRFKKQPSHLLRLSKVIREAQQEGATDMQIQYLIKNIFNFQ